MKYLKGYFKSIEGGAAVCSLFMTVAMVIVAAIFRVSAETPAELASVAECWSPAAIVSAFGSVAAILITVIIYAVSPKTKEN